MLHTHDGWLAFWVPKKGNSKDEYEDAFSGDGKVGRFAIADGASESSFASLWAKLLVDGFVRVPDEQQSEDWLAAQRKRWSAEIGNRALPWYAEEKAQQGAFATFLGLIIRPATIFSSGRWKAVAVGDSCIFQVRGDRLIGSFPVSSSQAFNNTPSLLGSKNACDRSRVEWGKWKPADILYLMTDALAQWFLACHERERLPWRDLDHALDGDADARLTAFIESLRDEKVLKNDDVTLMRISLNP